jgi:hypothetical protein
MNHSIDTTLSTQLSILAQKIQAANQEADTDGLMARFFLERHASHVVWQVSCDNWNWVTQNGHELRQGNFGKLAALGYSIWFSSATDRDLYAGMFVEGEKRLKQRELFPADQVSFPNIPSAFLGIVLGTLALCDGKDRTELMSWLKQVLNEALRRNNPVGFTKLVYDYIGTRLDKRTLSIPLPDVRCTLVELALIDWGSRSGVFQVATPDLLPQNLYERILTLACSVDVSELSAGESAVVWESVTSCLSSSIHDRVLSPSHVVQLLSRFESAMRRWRWDIDGKAKIVRWNIGEEREVQDIVWLVLRSVFDDVVDEDSLPKFGHSSYKTDFGIPSIGTLIEVKFSRKREDFKRIEKEVMEDAIAYLQADRLYRRLIVFIYDDSASVQEHALTKSALEKLPNVEGVVIVSRPSQLPEAGEQ